MWYVLVSRYGTVLSSRNASLCPFQSSTTTTLLTLLKPTRSKHHSDFCHHRAVLSSLGVNINGIIWNVLLHVWFISLSIMFLRFIHIAVCVSRSFLFNYWVKLHWWIRHTLFIFLFLNASIEVGFSVIIETLFHHSNSSYWWTVQSCMEIKFISLQVLIPHPSYMSQTLMEKF